MKIKILLAEEIAGCLDGCKTWADLLYCLGA